MSYLTTNKMKNPLSTSIEICFVLILLLTSCENKHSSKSTHSSEKAEMMDVGGVNAATTLTSIDEKWNVKMFTVNKSEIRFGSGGDLSNFENHEFYCLEINRQEDDNFKVGSSFPLHKQSSPSAHERHLSIFVFDSLKCKYSDITEGYDFEKKQFQFFLSTDLFNGFENKVNIAIDYYSSSMPFDFDPFSSHLPLILFEDVPISKIGEEGISNNENIPKANDEWFRLKKLRNYTIERQ